MGRHRKNVMQNEWESHCIHLYKRYKFTSVPRHHISTYGSILFHFQHTRACKYMSHLFPTPRNRHSCRKSYPHMSPLENMNCQWLCKNCEVFYIMPPRMIRTMQAIVRNFRNYSVSDVISSTSRCYDVISLIVGVRCVVSAMAMHWRCDVKKCADSAEISDRRVFNADERAMR